MDGDGVRWYCTNRHELGIDVLPELNDLECYCSSCSSEHTEGGLHMARRTVVTFVDDLDGKELKEAVTIAFSVDGKKYEFDTSPAHAKEFRRDLEKYISASRSAGNRRSRGSRRSRSSARDSQAVRAWARDAGYEVSDRGRISSEIVAAYEAAN